jgi:ribosomal-protein-alanine N-acetyltransferase
MTVRVMETEDLDSVMEIENEAFSPPWTKEGFFTFLIREDTLFLTAEDKSGIVGYAGLLMVLDEAEILNIAVRHDRRKEGIGHFLMQSLLLLSGESGIHTIHLEVRESNHSARRLYTRHGFKEGFQSFGYRLPR